MKKLTGSSHASSLAQAVARAASLRSAEEERKKADLAKEASSKWSEERRKADILWNQERAEAKKRKEERWRTEMTKEIEKGIVYAKREIYPVVLPNGRLMSRYTMGGTDPDLSDYAGTPSSSEDESEYKDPTPMMRTEVFWNVILGIPLLISTFITMTQENVFFFVPNLIGYGRILLAIVSCLLMPYCPLTSVGCYFTSALLDAVDGHAARFFNQSTKFGAMLDQLTDRCGTMCLMMILAVFYPSCSFLFQISASTDIAMHWLHLHTSLSQGKLSHKAMSEEEPYLLQLYYTSKPILFVMCCGNEIFYMSLYLLHFYSSYFLTFLAIVSFPIAVGKWAMAILQGVTAGKNLAAIDVAEREEQKKD